MADPAFPNVPPFPGVPALSRGAGSALVPQIPRLTNDSPAVAQQLGSAEKPRWGIYSNDGVSPVVTADSVIMVDFDKESQIPTYPQEQGTFQSYNKVARPREMMVKLAQGGSKYERERFLKKCGEIRDDTKLYSVVQPELFYPNMNFTRMRYDRSNPQLIVVELYGEEVRLTATQAFSDTKNPNDANAANQGNVATQAPTAAQASAISTPQ